MELRKDHVADPFLELLALELRTNPGITSTAGLRSDSPERSDSPPLMMSPTFSQVARSESALPGSEPAPSFATAVSAGARRAGAVGPPGVRVSQRESGPRSARSGAFGLL